MSKDAWTESLVEEWASPLRGGAWARVERAKDGRLLALRSGGPGVEWVAVEQPDAAVCDPLTDRRLTACAPAVGRWLRSGWSVKLLAYRVGSRAVWELVRGDEVRLAKVYRKDRDYAVRWAALAPSGPFRTPSVWPADGGEPCLEMERCTGASLYDRWAADSSGDEGEMLAGLVRWLHRQSVPASLPHYSKSDESEALGERIAEFGTTLRQPPSLVLEVAREVQLALAGAEEGDLVVCHRDLHDKQVIVGPDGVALIDLDLLAVGPIGLDAGNLLAHLCLRGMQRRLHDWQRVARPLAQAARDDVGGPRVGRWVASTLSRLSLIYARRARGAGLLERLATEARSALERRGVWAELLR